MLKGAVDHVHHERVGGWVYSELGSVRGATVLAFVDDRCVGSGKVDLFRKDLEAAGLGDGYLGFSFPISLSDLSEIGKLIVKIEGSDAALLPRAAKVSTPPRSHGFREMRHGIESIEWMRSQGWISSMEYTFLKYTIQLGVFEYSLVKQKTPNEPGAGIMDAKSIATEYLQLIALSGAAVESVKITSGDPEAIRSAVLDSTGRPYPVVAILADKSSSISVIEGSHDDSALPQSLEGAISYPIGRDRLFFLNLLCGFGFEKGAPSTPLTIFAVSGA